MFMHYNHTLRYSVLYLHVFFIQKLYYAAEENPDKSAIYAGC